MRRSVLAIALVPTLVLCVLAASTRYYAGYYFKGKEWNAPWGVSADIKTINPSVPWFHFVAEWDCIILSYDPLYWVQAGYDKGGIVGRRYYIAKQDYYGHSIKHFGSPSAGSWHTYKICHAQESGQWTGKYRFWIDGQDVGYYNVTPYVPKDQQSLVETDTTSISIDGSHFQ